MHAARTIGQLDGNRPKALTALEFKDVLSRASTPVTVVATNGLFGLAGVTCSAVCSVSTTRRTVLRR